MTGTWTITMTAALLGQTPAATDAAGTAAPPRAVDEWQIEVLAGVWLPRLDGTASLAGPEIELEKQFDLGEHETSPNVELTIRRNEQWDLIFSAFHFETGTTNFFRGAGTFGGLPLASGTLFQGSFEMTSLAVELGVVAWRPLADGSRRAREGLENTTWDGRYIADLRFSPQFGFRYLDVDHRLFVPGAGTAITGGEWAAAYAGFDVTLDWRPEQRIPGFTSLRLQAGTALGPALGGDEGLYWQVRAGITLHFTELFGVTFGYRLAELDVDNGPYSLAGGLQGLFVAGSLRF